MNRGQALILSIIAGLVMLSFIIIIVLLIVPPGQIFPTSTPTITPTLRPTPTPTFPNFMPTPSFETPLPPEPSPTNTRLPTATPQLPATATPTVQFDLDLLTPFVRPTATLTPTIPPPPPSPTEPAPTATPLPNRQYSISFTAAKTSLNQGDCTDLRWNVQGAVALVQLDGQSVSSSGARRVCPSRTTTYALTTQLENTAQIERRTVQITVN